MPDPHSANVLHPDHTDRDAHLAVTGWHALTGLAIGLLAGSAADGSDGREITIAAVRETAADLAVADRVAWVLATRTGRPHVVLATDTAWIVAELDAPGFTWADALRLQPATFAPRIASIASSEGVLPVLLAAG